MIPLFWFCVAFCVDDDDDDDGGGGGGGDVFAIALVAVALVSSFGMFCPVSSHSGCSPNPRVRNTTKEHV